MKKIHLIFCCALAFGVTQSGWAADPGSGGDQGGQAVSAPATTEAPSVRPHDKNGRPMTPEEFAKAEEERMNLRTTATQNRLETKQSRWKKKPAPVAAKKPAVPQSSVEPGKEPGSAPKL